MEEYLKKFRDQMKQLDEIMKYDPSQKGKISEEIRKTLDEINLRNKGSLDVNELEKEFENLVNS